MFYSANDITLSKSWPHMPIHAENNLLIAIKSSKKIAFCY